MAHGRHWPGDVQLEYCDICGVRLPAAERIQATTQELAGRWACPKCAPLVLNPSYLDFGGPGNLAPEPGEVEPHSGADWVTSIQGENQYQWFYAGVEDPQATPDVTSGVNASFLYAIPFTLPRRLIGNVAATVTLGIATVTVAPAVVEVALYKQTRALTTPGVLVQDLGSATCLDGQVATFSPNLFLSGDGIYFLLYRCNGSASSTGGFTSTYSNNILGEDILAFYKSHVGTEWDFGNEWPRTGGPVPWPKIRAPYQLPAWKLALEA